MTKAYFLRELNLNYNYDISCKEVSRFLFLKSPSWLWWLRLIGMRFDEEFQNDNQSLKHIEIGHETLTDQKLKIFVDHYEEKLKLRNFVIHQS